jgi:hypothetical protein
VTNINDGKDIQDAPIQQMSVDEFWKLGFIQELNRRVLHPCGLAISVMTDDHGNATGFGEIWDYRNDPEGIYFGPAVGPDPAKYNSVQRLFTDHAAARKQQLGFVVQPVPEENHHG